MYIFNIIMSINKNIKLIAVKTITVSLEPHTRNIIAIPPNCHIMAIPPNPKKIINLCNLELDLQKKNKINPELDLLKKNKINPELDLLKNKILK